MSPLEVIVGTLFFGACVFTLALLANHRLARLQDSALPSTRAATNAGSEEVFVVRRESIEGRVLERISRRFETLREKK
jgi:hypothetical protein